jgi:prepilin-type N-terminal cleavage/methylation domain-containing protein
MKQGFTLIEVLVATLISAILGTMLFALFSQISSLTGKMSQRINEGVYRSIVIRQLERDLAGVYVPAEIPKEQAEFICTVQEKQLSELSFVTTNSIIHGTTCSPASVRVRYSLTPEKKKNRRHDTKPTYTLMRQESTTLDTKGMKEDKNQTGYVLAYGLSECTIECTSITIDQKGEQKREKSMSWPLKQEKAQKAQPKEQEKLTLPALVSLTLSWPADTITPARSYSATMNIASYKGVPSPVEPSVPTGPKTPPAPTIPASSQLPSDSNLPPSSNNSITVVVNATSSNGSSGINPNVPQGKKV